MEILNDQSKHDKGEIYDVQLVVASKNTAKPFESSEKSLNFVTPFIKLFIIFPWLQTIGIWWNNQLKP